jgi:hypothetical protein
MPHMRGLICALPGNYLPGNGVTPKVPLRRRESVDFSTDFGTFQPDGALPWWLAIRVSSRLAACCRTESGSLGRAQP